MDQASMLNISPALPGRPVPGLPTHLYSKLGGTGPIRLNFSREIVPKGIHYNAFTFNQRPVTVVPLHAHPQALIMIETHPDFKFAAEKNIEKDREDITSC